MDKLKYYYELNKGTIQALFLYALSYIFFIFFKNNRFFVTTKSVEEFGNLDYALIILFLFISTIPFYIGTYQFYINAKILEQEQVFSLDTIIYKVLYYFCKIIGFILTGIASIINWICENSEHLYYILLAVLLCYIFLLFKIAEGHGFFSIFLFLLSMLVIFISIYEYKTLDTFEKYSILTFIHRSFLIPICSFIFFISFFILDINSQTKQKIKIEIGNNKMTKASENYLYDFQPKNIISSHATGDVSSMKISQYFYYKFLSNPIVEYYEKI